MSRFAVVGLALAATWSATGGIALAKTDEGLGYTLWSAPSTVKIAQDAKPGTMPAEGLAIEAARGEYESVQLCITAGDRDVKIGRVTVSEFRAAANDAWEGITGRIAAEEVQVRRVAYVSAPTHPDPMPDPLPPAAGFTVPAGKTQPVWLTVHVPAGTPAGTCAARVTVVGADGKESLVPLFLTVWDFDLPTTPHLRTAFGISRDLMATAEGAEGDEARTKALYAKYYENLLEHRVSAYDIPAELTSPEAAKYLDDPRMTSFAIPWSDDEAELKRVADYLREHNWLAKGFYYPLDEPVNQDAYNQLKAYAEKLKRAVPDRKQVAPYFSSPDFAKGKTIVDLMAGYLNIWCANTGYWETTEAQVREREKLGEENWWYICCGPGQPYANMFVNQEAIQHRILPWQNWLYDVSGILYWSTTYWSPASTKDVWEDIATVKDISPNIYGDGSLFYPGKGVGVDGPVSSIRLEMLRDGMEDYEYLWLLTQKKGKAAADRAARKLVTDLTHYSLDPAKVESVREKMAREIEG